MNELFCITLDKIADVTRIRSLDPEIQKEALMKILKLAEAALMSKH